MENKRRRTIRGILLITGLSLLAVGIAFGGANDIFSKAVNICTECIGIG